MAKKVCLYGILSSLCIVFSFVEHLAGLDFIAPGVKLGLSNSVVLVLIALGDIKGAFSVNIVRILLSGMLFSSPFAMAFSFAGGILSMLIMAVFSKFKAFSLYGVSVLGAVTHNLAQLMVAWLVLGAGVWYYSPILLVSALICGMLTSLISKLVLRFNKSL